MSESGESAMTEVATFNDWWGRRWATERPEHRHAARNQAMAAWSYLWAEIATLRGKLSAAYDVVIDLGGEVREPEFDEAKRARAELAALRAELDAADNWKTYYSDFIDDAVGIFDFLESAAGRAIRTQGDGT